MRRKTAIIAVLLVALLAGSCQRRPFSQRTTGVDLRLRIETEIVNNADVEMPENMRVDMFDVETGDLKYTDYVGPEGGYIYPEPGMYDMVVYNIGTEATQIRNERCFDEVEAYTDDVSAFIKSQLAKFLEMRAKERSQSAVEAEEERVVWQPDHLFVGRKLGVAVPMFLEEEGRREIVIELEAESVVETWVVEVRPVEGTQWIDGVVSLMSGQAESTLIASGEDTENQVSVYFEMEVMDNDDGTKSLKGTFNTFGKLPHARSDLSFDLNVTDTGGNDHHFRFDVTDRFEDNEERYILIEQKIVIEEPKAGAGGFDPKVEDWEDVNTDIKL